MDPRLKKIVQNLKRRYQENPPGDDLEVDAGTLLQIEILQSGLEFNEVDVLAAAQELGIPEGGLIDWLEQMASWV
jgi:hypothetical protein